MHRFTNRHRQGTVPARLALVVIALLFGLLGMHALSVGHSMIPGHADRMSAAQMSTAHMGAQTSGSGDHLKATVVSATAGDAAHAAYASEGGGNGSGMGDHAMGGMLMLCLAVLGAAATLLLSRVFTRRLSWWRPTVEAATATLVAATTRVRSTGPPPVWEFSVIRC